VLATVALASRSRPVTDVALGAARGLDYTAIALVVGTLVFLVWIAPPRLHDSPFERRAWLLLGGGLALGVVASVLGVLLQGAEVARLSLWSALRWSVISSVLGSRFGVVWAIAAALFAVSIATLALRRRRAHRLWLGAVCAYLVITPALSGDGVSQSPVWALFPSDAVHVLAASVWVGGVACIVLALPATLRALDPRARTPLLVEVLGRFSPLALYAVVAIAVTGVLQAYIEVRSTNALTRSTFGELVLLKIGLLGLLIGLGAVNRERVLPALRRLLEAGAEPGETGRLIANTARAELATMACVLGVSAALIAFTPPVRATAARRPDATAQASRVRVRQAPATSQPPSQSASTTTAAPALIVRPPVSGSG
jgi:copper transport protein